MGHAEYAKRATRNLVGKARLKRIGIYAGTFNPIHAGHIGFALQAKEAAKLDEVCFLPERHPRQKTGAEHYGHRVAMITKAIKPYSAFTVGELPDIRFTVKKTLPELEKRYKDDQLVILLGSDLVPHLGSWEYATRLLSGCELVVGIREGDDEQVIKHALEQLPAIPKNIYLFQSYGDDISSTKIRDALLSGTYTKGLLTSVQRYSNKHWLYVTVAANSQ